MDTRGGGSPIVDSHRTTGGGGPEIPDLEVSKTTEETLLRSFGPPVGCLPASITVTRGDGLPGSGVPRVPPSHPTPKTVRSRWYLISTLIYYNYTPVQHRSLRLLKNGLTTLNSSGHAPNTCWILVFAERMDDAAERA